MHVLSALVASILLPGFTHFAAEPNGGELLQGVFPGTPRAGFVYLPPSFDSSTRYPVVYLLHGLPGSPAEYVDGTQLGEFADAQIAAGTLRPFIAVIPAAGTTPRYSGEWAGRWESRLVGDVVPWVDGNLPTIASAGGRILAGLSSGGFGAVDIGLRHPGLFGTIESWSGYFSPLHDGPFAHAGKATLAANDPVELVHAEAATLRSHGSRFFVSTGPFHSRLISPAATLAFARELDALGLMVQYRAYPDRRGEWRDQLDEGLTWALSPSLPLPRR